MKIISAGTQAETLKTQLVQGRSGDVKAAERDLAWIQDFAAKTPYDLADVSAAFISARNAGIDPMNGSLMAMGDAASALGKTYGDAIGMMMDAQQDEFARLPEFGIKAAKKGDTATFRYFDRSGKAMVKSVKMAGHNVEQALTEILRDKYGGGMEAIAKTTGGKWANLNDKITQRAVNVWNGGFGAEVQRQLDRATKAFDDAERNGSADRWSKSTSQALAGVVKTMGDADWEGFAKDVKGVAGAFVELGTFAGWAAGKLGELRKWMADKELKADQYTGFLGSIEYSNGGLVPHAPGWAKRLFGGSKSSAGAKAQGLAPFKDRNAAQAAGKMRFPSRFADVPFMDPSKPQGSEADHKKARDAIWRDALRQRNRSLPPPRGQAPAGARPAPAPTGKIALHVTADRGLTVRPTKVAASGMALDVNTGRAMGGFA
ncbi:MAG: hypothetical protein WAO77_10930 [Sphingobium sp.]|uniref:hypothetical protein n=1 Tax=Sphingobium sp. TaxID=1912891 RepID=UPI003BAF6BB3